MNDVIRDIAILIIGFFWGVVTGVGIGVGAMGAKKMTITIKRNHRCESCGKIYSCSKCTEYMEEALTEKRGRMFGGTITDPECMKQFRCEDCEEKECQ